MYELYSRTSSNSQTLSCWHVSDSKCDWIVIGARDGSNTYGLTTVFERVIGADHDLQLRRELWRLSSKTSAWRLWNVSMKMHQKDFWVVHVPIRRLLCQRGRWWWQSKRRNSDGLYYGEASTTPGWDMWGPQANSCKRTTFKCSIIATYHSRYSWITKIK